MIRYATCTTWAEWFEKHEGVRVSDVTIRNKLKEAGEIGRSARNRVGRLLKDAYFSEQAVRVACADLLRPLLQADESGFFVLNEIRYGTSFAWSKELGVSARSIFLRLNSASETSMMGKGSGGQIQKFYSEPSVRAVCSDLLRPMPQADRAGFFVVGGIRHGTIKAWSRELGLSTNAFVHRLSASSVTSMVGKDSSGQIQDFYPEPTVIETCAGLLKPVPRAEKSGFFLSNDIRYGTARAWSRELGLSEITVASRLRSASIVSMRGKDYNSHLQDFFPESSVYRACGNLLHPRLGADKSGFFILNNVRYGTKESWSRELNVSMRAIDRRLDMESIESVEGKSFMGHVFDFYPEPAVRAVCADLLGLFPQCDDQGFVGIGNIRHGTKESLARLLGISPTSIRSRLASSSLASVLGKNKSGHLVDLWPEPLVRKLCADLLDLSLVQVGEDGFADIGGIRHGTREFFVHLFGVKREKVKAYILQSGIIPVRGKSIQGKPVSLYPEPAVLEACKDLLTKKISKS
jgi:hypothetical protein